MRRFLFVFPLIAGMVLAMAPSAAAQGVTTAAISGRVTDAQGAPLSGVQVVVTQTATGVSRGVLTRNDGRYLLPGLAPGGPYRIEVRSLGRGTEIRESVTLALGQTTEFNFALSEQAVEIEGIEVTAARSAIISEGRTGTSAVVDDSTIARMPTITRDFTDFTRLVPQVSTGAGTSAAGRNNRFNSIQIDGAVNNDLFGLAASGTPGGQAGTKPITLEAIQEFQVVIAPFDVRQGGFTGAGINAVTKSGTNDFKGSVSYYGKNEGLVGTYQLPGGQTAPDVDDFSQNDLAFSLGGPVIQDRMHFFVAGERSERSSPIGTVVGVNADVTPAQVQEVYDYLVGQYDFNPGEMGAFQLGRESMNLFGRLDFNINDQHRLTLRHNYVDAFDDNPSRSPSSYGFGNSGYVFNSLTNSSVLQLNSALSNTVFNELRLGYSTVRDNRDIGQPFPRIRIDYAEGSVIAGPDNYSGKNALDQDIFEITNDLTVMLGEHTLVFGTSNELFSFSNLFVRNALGNYTFASFDDFVAGDANYYEYSYLLPGGDERAEFPARRYSFYAQDAWDVTPDFVLNLGLRYDLSTLPESPKYNAAVEDAYGVRTDAVPSSNGLFNPRVGFNWDVLGDRTTQVRGGAGFFSGRTPFVWISNAYGNTGLDYVRFSCNERFGDTAPAFTADPDNQPTSCAAGGFSPPNEINLVDPDFKFPQVFRTSFAIDRELPFGLIGTLEGLHTKTVHDVLYQNLNVGAASGTVEGGRPYYTRNRAAGIGDVILMTNTDEGYSYNLTAQVQRPFRDDWSFSAAYTYSQAKDVNPVTSSQAISNWRYNLTSGDPNNPPLGTSAFEVPHRILMSGSYRLDLLDRAPTDLSFIYVGESGRPYTFAYGDDINNDGSFGNDLMYVPASQDEIRFAESTNISAEQSWQNLNSLIESVSCLNEARGTIIGRGACRQPWSNRLDVRLAQNLRTFGTQQAQLTLDVLNFMNMLNSDWGVVEYTPYEDVDLLRLQSGSTPDAEGRHQYRPFAARDNVFQISNLASRYQVQLGIRYTF